MERPRRIGDAERRLPEECGIFFERDSPRPSQAPCADETLDAPDHFRFRGAAGHEHPHAGKFRKETAELAEFYRAPFPRRSAAPGVQNDQRLAGIDAVMSQHPPHACGLLLSDGNEGKDLLRLRGAAYRLEEVQVVFEFMEPRVFAVFKDPAVEEKGVPPVAGPDPHRDAGEPGDERQVYARMRMKNGVVAPAAEDADEPEEREFL